MEPTHYIAFHLSHFSISGKDSVIYNYAHYNEEILKNKSLIVVQSNFRNINSKYIYDENTYKRFNSRFKIIEYDTKSHLTSILKDEGVDIFYNLESGENDGFLIHGVKNVCHTTSIFSSLHHHGDVYIPISLSIVGNNTRSITPIVPLIISPLPITEGNLRSRLNIPESAFVFGRYGGEDSFNIPFVHEAIADLATQNPNIYFIFANTKLFTSPRSNIIFIQSITDPIDKTTFINTCDAMIHGKKEGEIFGVSIAEFSMMKKPIITWKRDRSFQEVEKDFNMKMDTESTHHIDVLGNSGFYYSDKESLINLIKTFKKIGGDDKYTDVYSPIKVMDLFDKHIINTPFTRFIESMIFDNQIYTYFYKDNISKSLKKNGWEPHVYDIIRKIIKPTDTFIDIGANIGYHTIRISPFVEKVISIEPCKIIFDLLVNNVSINNLKNVICVMSGLSSDNRIMYLQDPDENSTNFGDLRIKKNKVGDSKEIKCVNLDYLLEGQESVDVIKIDVSGSEIDVIKGGIKTILKFKHFIIIPLESNMFETNSCFGLKYLLNVLGYSLMEIHSDYPCDHICYPNEKTSIIEEIFSDNIVQNTQNSVNDNNAIGITQKIVLSSDSNRQIRVKLLCNWTTGGDLCKCWNKMSKGDCKWNDITIVSDDKDIDYYIIINKPLDGDFYIPNKTMVFRMEPDTSTAIRWNDWYKNKKDFMYFFDLDKYMNNNEWHLDLSYSELCEKNILKSKTISTVVSSLYIMDGHKKRIDFIKYCQERGLEIDVYGRDNTHQLKNHKGELPYHNKNNGILPYKYTFITENCSLENYFTEKIIDAILGESLCFYWGCPNIDSFINPKAYIRLDMNDMDISYNTIITSINNNEWSNRLPYIMKEKEKILTQYSFFPRIEGYIKMSKLDCRVINNDETRWIEFVKRANKEDFFNFKKSLNRGLDFTLWKSITKDTLVLEDNVILCKGFNDRLSMIYRYLKEEYPDFDILYIGCHNESVEDIDNVYIESLDYMNINKNFRGFGGYILSPSGSKKMVLSLQKENFTSISDIDYQVLGMKSYYCINPLVFL